MFGSRLLSSSAAISEDTWRQVQGKVAANFVDDGEQSLKNIARPVRSYRVLPSLSSVTVAAEVRPVIPLLRHLPPFLTL